ncbi:hypothetical protein RRG08_055065 [Elysia crispata]|uniref:Uncharacterized protein n=1 Tax=Elysia crispata TaxID=231223 RepID=A0AAE1E7A2_9GAST|nr:hypothetical protein RRG08_055065 [Elysia crispata]
MLPIVVLRRLARDPLTENNLWSVDGYGLNSKPFVGSVWSIEEWTVHLFSGRTPTSVVSRGIRFGFETIHRFGVVKRGMDCPPLLGSYSYLSVTCHGQYQVPTGRSSRVDCPLPFIREAVTKVVTHPTFHHSEADHHLWRSASLTRIISP